MKEAEDRGAQALATFLDQLTPGSEGVGARYERLRERLVMLFRCRGCAMPEDLADETIDRVGRRLVEGVVLTRGDIIGYAMGTAEYVAKEARRRDLRIVPFAAEELPAAHGAEPVDEAAVRTRARLVGRALAEIPGPERRLLLLYIKGKAPERARLAAEAGLALNALRIRIHRLRVRLETRVAELSKGARS
jgi:DNA-directed RNA polymerase specialized sigma24 family protein